MIPDIGIVLTGTINPNTTFVVHSDANERKKEYLEAINYYKNFGTVYFLENSTYDVLSDSDFNSINNVFLRKFSPSEFYDKGKGYQEFEMISAWVKLEPVMPKRFIKITGRYMINNFGKIYKECLARNSEPFLIDIIKKNSVAHTCCFCVNTSYFKKYLISLYLDCNDKNGDWVEKILYKKILLDKIGSKFFFHEPRYDGLGGSTGVSLKSSNCKHVIKVLLRRINYIFNEHYILY